MTHTESTTVVGASYAPPATRLAYASDIPGTRCGPDDGPWPRAYYPLSERDAQDALRAMSNAKRVDLGEPQTVGGEGGRSRRRRHVDTVSFQPFRAYQSQDKHVVQQLDVHGEIWTMSAVFDGHLGGSTVAHTAYHMPIIIRDFFREECVNGKKAADLPPNLVSEILSKSMSSFDDAIADDVINIFPGGIEALDEYSDEEIHRMLNDRDRGGENYQKVRLCMHGTTALVALVDPTHRNLWIANLGDCDAVLVTPAANGKWEAQLLTTPQNGDNGAEIARVRSEHPGEAESVVDGRVLGALAPTRSIGDIPFKQPPIFTRRILYNLEPGLRDHAAWEEFLERNLTPPYITAEPDVIQQALPSSPPMSPQVGPSSSTMSAALTTSPPSSFPFFRLPSAASAITSNLFGNGTTKNGATNGGSIIRRSSLGRRLSSSSDKKDKPSPSRRPSFLILASDGLSDLYHGRVQSKQDMANMWADAVVQAAVPQLAGTTPTGRRSSQRGKRRLPIPTSFINPIPIKRRRASSSSAQQVSTSPGAANGLNGSAIANGMGSGVGSDGSAPSENLALALLRAAIGGEDLDAVSRTLTLQMNEPWIDDTTILVQTL